uniref:Uncharacterized protein n=1 Tax=Nicotiana tabacum TaxID=4097 RepID=A0A1S4BL65_TOBAC|nr:PREDICTED: uncharacterized protein LOC107809505 [Nicotiana tabacum]
MPMYADECTAKQLKVSYARMLIEVDVTKPLKDEITVEEPNRRTFLQPINYDWKPKFCETCQVIGHNCKQEGRGQNQYGATMNEKRKPKKITQQWVTKEKAKTKQAEEEPMPEQELIMQQQETIRVMEAGQGSGVIKIHMPVLHEDQTPKFISKNQEVERTSPEFNDINFSVLGSVPLRNGFQLLSREGNGAHTISHDIGGSAYQIDCLVTIIYGFNTIEQRKGLWKDLKTLAQGITRPWLVIGDFKAMFYSADRDKGNPVQQADIQDFGNIVVEYELPGISDHAPMLLTMGDEQNNTKCPFRFFNVWAEHKEFDQIVEETCKQVKDPSLMRGIWRKLKTLRTRLKILNNREFRNAEQKMKEAKNEIRRVQSEMQ